MHFLLKRIGGILYFNGHVTYDLSMTPKNNIVVKMELWDLKTRTQIILYTGGVICGLKQR